MDFSLSQEQRLLQDALTGLLREHWPMERLRQYAAGDGALEGELNAKLNAFGLAGLLVPEGAGGQGLGLLDACLVQECLGYHLAPAAFASQAIAASALKPMANTASLQASLASGTMRPLIALTEAFSERSFSRAHIEKDRASGRLLFVQSTEAPTHVVTIASDERCLVAETSGAVIKPLHTIDRTRCFCELNLTSAPVISSHDRAGETAINTALLLAAADTLGAAQAMLDQAVAYSKTRKQFDRVIGSFQAVKHLCAEMAAQIEPARALIWHAAHALDSDDPEGALMAHLAKAHLAEVGTFVARTATEVHGGMGFTDLLGLHYWFKRIGVNRQMFGTPETLRERAARIQGLVA